ncbi:HAMP domain-containing histidine kinase [Marinilongibacter aquaticus]|uniref:sensor histidine kinase n=1 Tax=Marinilongibacter aquaticus TaxID=2975157 RepID=UPI0021BDE44A|nr:HAMP domain-containing sensor histidine kinase [Marinilongibacter aquaticus]UBM57992.1 HAMP domain-containing histidine kinase [Marinilongibacter aquaticus]
MASNKMFFNIYQQFSVWRISVIAILLVIGAGVIFYFNLIGKELEDREEVYARLYAESLRFFIEQEVDASCDYTFVSEVVEANKTIPAIVVIDGKPVNYVNVEELADTTKNYSLEERDAILMDRIALMAEEHAPILIEQEGIKLNLYYSSSEVLKQLRFFPYIILTTFLIFGSLAYIAYNSSRRAEQNRVWVGLAKETAHQLGTPISGLLGWIAVLRTQENFDDSIGDEMEKDIHRLETITTRFSNIGSIPSMKEENIGQFVEQTILYLERRISTKIQWTVKNELPPDHMSKINKNLFEWVIENLCKNAVDAMAGVGQLSVHIFEVKDKVFIDLKDSGKGMTKAQQIKVFNPGYSTKKRGWGLGLTLAKRIIETYHKGKLFVKESEPGQGTTFRIII